jgi:hypothetical protein
VIFREGTVLAESHSRRSCSLETTDEVVTRVFAAASGAAEIVELLEAELPDTADEILLDSMTISIYGGG